jgi:hypothetical protein
MKERNGGRKEQIKRYRKEEKGRKEGRTNKDVKAETNKEII